MLVGLVIIAAVSLVVWAVLRQQNTTVSQTLPILSFETDASQFSSMLARSGDSSQTPFVPADDVGGNSNADGHELDFYYLPTAGALQGRGVFYALCGRTTATDCTASQAVGTLGTYTYIWSAVPQHGGTGATFVTGSADTRLMPFGVTVASTAAQFANASVNPYSSVMFASTTFTTPQTYQWGYPGLTSTTNTVFIVHYGTGIDARVVALRATHVPVSVQYLNGTQTPTPNPLDLSGLALSFRAPVAAAQSVTISESNYGNRSTTPPQVYTLGSGCNSLTLLAPGTPVTPVGNGSGDATLTVTPIIQLAGSDASCSIGVTDNTPQSQTIGVAIGQVYVPTASGLTIAFTAGATDPVTVQEQNYDVPAPGRGGMVLIGYLANGSQALSSADTAGDPNGICNTAPGTSGRTGDSITGSPSFLETESWSIGFVKAGVCWPVFQDVYGQRVVPNGATGIAATATLQTWPQQLVLGASAGQIGTTAGSTPIALMGNPFEVAMGPIITYLTGGGIARAASGAQACYALAVTTAYSLGANPVSYVDTSLPAALSAATGVYVDSSGCEVDANDNPISATSAAMIAYNSGGGVSDYQYSYAACNNLSQPLWSGNNDAAQAVLTTSGTTAGLCSLNFSGTGLSSGTPGPDAGVVVVNVTACDGANSEQLINGTCYVIFLDDVANCLSPPNIGSVGGESQCAGTAADPNPSVWYGYFYTPASTAATAFAIGAGGQEMSPNGLCSRPVYGFTNESLWTMFAGWDDPNNVATITGVPSSTNYTVSNGLGFSVVNETSATISLDTLNGSISPNPWVVTPAQPTPWPPPCTLGGPPEH